MKNCKILNSVNGFTFLELIIAIAVASIVVMLAMRFLQDTYAGIRLQGRRISSVEQMILCRKNIGKHFDQIETVIEITNDRMIFTCNGSDSVHIIEKKDNALLLDNIQMMGKIKNIHLELDKKGKEENALLWECELESGKTVYGAKKVLKYSPAAENVNK